MDEFDVNDAGRRIGQGHPNAKYSDRMVESILRLADAGLSAVTIAMVLGMPASTVRAFLNGWSRRQEPSVEARWRKRRKRRR